MSSEILSRSSGAIVMEKASMMNTKVSVAGYGLVAGRDIMLQRYSSCQMFLQKRDYVRLAGGQTFPFYDAVVGP